MSSPLVSVVIPMLDAAPTIERCLQSCLSLAWGALEIIVVDNGSVDDSRERVVRLAGSSRCPILLLECEERGPGVARNHAMPHVHGDYVVWLDADDALFRDKIAEQVEALRPFRDTPAIASCDVIVENIRTGNDAVVDSIFSLLPTASEREMTLFGKRGAPPAGYLLTRSAADLLHASGGFLDVRCQDREYFARARLLGIPFVHVPRVLALYRNGSPRQVTRQLDRLLWAPALAKCHASLRATGRRYGIALSEVEARSLERSWDYHVFRPFDWSLPEGDAMVRSEEGVERVPLDPLERAIVVACQHSPVVFTESLAAGTAQAFPMLAPAFSRLLAAAERLLETRLLRWVDAATAAALCRARGR